MSPSLHTDPLLAHRQEMDALRVRYESEAEFDPELAKACAREIEVLDFALYVGQAPDYERPLIFRTLIRAKNGVPVLKSVMLFRRELALAWAKAHHAGKD